jgi:hypothetical protein
MSKLGDFFLGFKKRYDAQVIRNEKMDEFLATAKENFDKIGSISTTVENLNTKVATLGSEVTGLKEQMADMNGRLEVIGRGTKIELLETLHKWRSMLVNRGWKTKEEMGEVKDLYELYNQKLKGNGQGTAYYHEIENLPEKEITE